MELKEVSSQFYPNSCLNGSDIHWCKNENYYDEKLEEWVDIDVCVKCGFRIHNHPKFNECRKSKDKMHKWKSDGISVGNDGLLYDSKTCIFCDNTSHSSQ